jgi:hypothetical protein
MIQKTGGMGIAIENSCAIEFIDGRFFRVINAKSNARAFRVYKRDGEVVTEPIPQEKRPTPLASLYDRRPIAAPPGRFRAASRSV